MTRKVHPFNFILTTRYKFRLIKKLLDPEKRGSLLDIGCGSGFILSQLQDQFDNLTGIDLSSEALKVAKNFTKAKLIKAEAENLPFKNSTFDYIISTDTFEHIVDDKKAIREVKRVLRPKGFFIIYVPSKKGILSKTRLAKLFHTNKKNYLMDRRCYSIYSLTKLIKDSGLRVEYVGYHNIFFQEFFTQVFKYLALKLGKKYEDQGDIRIFTSSPLFPIYRWIFLPFIDFLIFGEEFICEKIFKNKIPGHRIILVAKK